MTFDEIEGTEGQSGESTEAAPEPQQSSESQKASDSQSPEAKQTNEDTSKLPFNDPRSPHHDRFKELMEQRNEERKARSQLEQQLNDMRRQWEQDRSERNKPAPKKDAMVEKLMAIDPEFGKDYQALKESLGKVNPELEGLRAWKQEAESKALRAQYDNAVSKLHSDNKVDSALQGKYAMELEYKIKSLGDQARMEDVPKYYKEIHDEYTKLFSAREKAATETYLKGKRADAGVATGQSKGKAVSKTGDEGWTGNKEQDKALLIQKVLKMNKTGNSL